MGILLLLLYIVIIVMLFKTFAMRKQNKKMNKIIDLIKMLEEKDAYFTRADECIATAASEEEKTKFIVLKLWGLSYHKMYSEFLGLLEQLDITTLVPNQNDPHNDDSFFYLVLAIPNILQANNRWDEIKALQDKILANLDLFKNRLDYQIGQYCLQYYKNEGDKGFAFFEKIMDGEYEGLRYDKQLIGLYKQTVAVMLLKQYEERDDMEHYDEMKCMCENYRQTRIGEMWLNNMGIILGDGPDSIPDVQSNDNKTEDSVVEIEQKTNEEEVRDLADGIESGSSFGSVDEENDK